MKSRIFFYCAAIAALVLFLAATGSHATERRDPVVNSEPMQAPSVHAKDATKPARKRAHPAAKPQTQAKATPKKSLESSAGAAGNGK